MHIAKYTRSAAGHMLAHYDRAKDKNGNYVTDGRKGIDSTRTHLNYAVGGDFEMAAQRLQWLLDRDDVKCLNRKDVNVICDVVVTAPQDLPEQDQQKFFEVAYNFLADRYGVKNSLGCYDNILSSNVHMDETSPHMHFAFVPLVKVSKIDKKTGKQKEYLKVNAKQVINRTDLKTLHPDMTKVMKKAFGRDIGIENGITKANGGNQTVEQLKYKKELEDEVERLSKVAESQNKTILTKKQEIAQLNDKIADMTITGELHIALTEKQQTLKYATEDLQKLDNSVSISELDEMIKKWDCEVMPMIDQHGNILMNDREIDIMLNRLYDFLKNLIETIKEFFSQLLGEDYQKEITHIKEDIENDEIEME